MMNSLKSDLKFSLIPKKNENLTFQLSLINQTFQFFCEKIISEQSTQTKNHTEPNSQTSAQSNPNPNNLTLVTILVTYAIQTITTHAPTEKGSWKAKKIKAVVVSLEGRALNWFQLENQQLPIVRWEELKRFLLRNSGQPMMGSSRNSGWALFKPEPWLSTKMSL